MASVRQMTWNDPEEKYKAIHGHHGTWMKLHDAGTKILMIILIRLGRGVCVCVCAFVCVYKYMSICV